MAQGHRSSDTSEARSAWDFAGGTGYRAGIHRTYVSDLERGRRNPTATTLLALARTLGTTMSEVVGEAEAILSA